MIVHIGWFGKILVASFVVAHSTLFAQLQENSKLAQEPATVATEKETLEELGTRSELRIKFLESNPGARVHRLDMPMNAYDDRTIVGLRLNSIWVGAEATMVEFEGLAAQGKAISAVIHESTFVIQGKHGRARVLAAEGASRIKDRVGGDALLVRSGEKLLAIFERIDDFNPFDVLHRPRNAAEFVYFKGVDPRFKERYLAAAQRASVGDAPPELMRDFIAEYAKNDPDGKVRDVFLKLIQKMRAQNTFEGFYAAYSLLQDPSDAKSAIKLARNDEHRAAIEHMAVQTLADKSRLIDFSFQLDQPKVDSIYSNPRGGWLGMGKEVIREANALISGSLQVKLMPSRPIPLKYASYDFKFRVKASASQTGDQRGFGVGTANPTVGTEKLVTVRLGASSSQGSNQVTVGRLPVAYLDRGTMGGYTARWLDGDGRLTVELISVEPVK